MLLGGGLSLLEHHTIPHSILLYKVAINSRSRVKNLGLAALIYVFMNWDIAIKAGLLPSGLAGLSLAPVFFSLGQSRSLNHAHDS